MSQNDDYIIFEGISKPDSHNEQNAFVKEKKPVPGNFDSLFEELKVKCDPGKFMKPYDKIKIDIANEIYSQVLKSSDNFDVLRQLRIRAIKELDIKFSTAKLYENLIEICNPENFSPGNNYDAEKLTEANRLFADIKEHADDIENLERIAHEASSLIQIWKQRKEEEKKKQEERLKILDIERKYDKARSDYYETIIFVVLLFIIAAPLYTMVVLETTAKVSLMFTLFISVVIITFMIIIFIRLIAKKKKIYKDLKVEHNNLQNKV